MLDLRTLGTIDLRADGRSLLSVLSQPTRVALLVYLAAARPRGPHRRDVLTHLLWPERDGKSARSSLRQTLHRLRRSLGNDVLLGSGEQSLALAREAVWCDAVAFEEALDAGRLEEAMDYYQGPFLEGFHLADSVEFERWLDVERDYLCRRAQEAAWTLTEAARERRELEAAEVWARRAIDLNPYEERGWRRLMVLLEAHGERAAAVRAYEELAERFGRELDMEPSPETRALAERVQSGESGGARGPAAPDQAGKVEGRGSAGPADRAVGAPDEEKPRGGAEDSSAAGRSEGSARKYTGVAHPPVDDSGLPEPATGRGRSLGWAAVVVGIGALAMALGFPPFGPSERPPPAHEGPVEAPAPLAEDRFALPHDAAATKLAVLPFLDIGPDAEHAYFSEGLTEELIVALGRLDGIRVLAWTSVFAMGSERDVREAARELGVEVVVSGSARQDGDRIRVAAQLSNGADGSHLWSQVYDRPATDIFEVQEDIALRIAEALRVQLTREDRLRLGNRSPPDLEVYTDYLRARYFWNRRSEGGLASALDYFDRAIEGDPDFAPAHAGLASTFAPLAVLGYLAPAEASERMREAALKALGLDPTLGEAWTALAAYHHVFAWDYEAAERAYLRAIALDPDDPSSRTWYGYLLISLGRFDEALAERRRAVELDPLSPFAYGSLGEALRFAGMPDEALQAYRSAIELDSTFWLAHAGLGDTHELTGDWPAAVRAFGRAMDNAGGAHRPKAGLARVLARSGAVEEARELLRELETAFYAGGVHPPEVASVYLALGDREAALAWLESAHAGRHPVLHRLAVEPSFDALRGEPRFEELLARIGLGS